MAIPDDQTCVLALLDFFKDREKHNSREVISPSAREYAARIESKIIPIQGEQLAQYLIDSNVGVAPVSLDEVKKIDSDYFTDA